MVKTWRLGIVKEHLKDIPPALLRKYIAAQVCWICGRDGWMALSQHLCKKHQLSAAEVREMAYMFKAEKLIAPELSQRLSVIHAPALMRMRLAVKNRAVPHELSARGKDLYRQQVKSIQRLGSLAQAKQKRKPHLCPICGTNTPTSRPKCCSPACASVFMSQVATKNLTPERIENFRRHLYKPSLDERSANAKKFWEEMKKKPLAEQKAFYLKRAESRKAPLITVPCVICGSLITIPAYKLSGKRRLTCSRECSRLLHQQRGRERVIKDSTRAKLSAIAKARHKIAPLFGSEKRREGG